MIENQEQIRQRQTESREHKEADGLDKELKAAAAMERADFLTREVKSNQQQMQNIVIHLQQVMAAIKQLRAQLDISNGEIITSVAEDTKRVTKLKEQIQEYRSELESMRDELIREQTQEILAQHPNIIIGEAEALAIKKVTELYAQLDTNL